MKDAVTVRNENGEEVAAIFSVKRMGNKLIMDGKALGTMRMDMILTADDALKSIRLIFTWPVISFIFLLPYYALRNINTRKRTYSEQ